MMASCQLFLSGAILKTVNLPHKATVEDVLHIYEEGWRLGLKAIAIYKDCAKLLTPFRVQVVVPLPKNRLSTLLLPDRKMSISSTPIWVRVRLPKKRMGFTREARVREHKIFLRIRQHEDGC
ncbi:hypothetical protein [Pajaroellobacter abortibovis]|uniref:Ribonucleotide reductase large subunit C-terminal domain-containing protein n=1 Tax=Pajaroellobacter abortibovis TaxID=1882918 RepID=A0A1L6MXE3_9BACT|nr:hypothetical protein [Pajaroellobacter abortibovis]APS00058.1 hypothetical protein BCY86_04710 [Pajaroellobacter abortibovis]